MSAQKTNDAPLHAPTPVTQSPDKFPHAKRVMKGSESFGPPELCTWPVAPGTCRFQTTRPDFARKLSQRSGARLVAWSEQGGYLRVFEEAIEPWRARDLVSRFLTATNRAFLKPKRPLSRRKSPAVSPQQEVSV